jgi:hypothetical protein
MENREFELLIELKIRDIIAIVKERKELDFEKSLLYLYKSRLYRLLLRENTKLWHLSNAKLFDMLENEIENKQLIFPDYV